MSLLELHELNKHFGGLHVTNAVNLALEAGEIHCLIGPNGAGKSTLFRLGEYHPGSGDIFFAGENITALKSSPRIHRGLSVKFQVPGVFKGLSVRQNLEIALQRQHRGVERGRDRPAAGVPQPRSRADADGGQFEPRPEAVARDRHGGQPEAAGLLLLDEPTAGMSPEETHLTGEMVQRLNAEGMTVLAIEHDMAFVRQVAQRVTVLHLGQVFRARLDRGDRRRRARRRHLSGGRPMRKEVILTTLGLRAGYGGKPVLQGLEIEVREGEIVAVIGRNGVGKSTLMKSLIGLVTTRWTDRSSIAARPSNCCLRTSGHGSAWVTFRRGRDVFPRLTVAENIAVGAAIKGGIPEAGRRRVVEAFPDPRRALEPARRHHVRGQQQQLAIGRVLIADPNLILLDEPSKASSLTSSRTSRATWSSSTAPPASPSSWSSRTST